MSSLTSTAKRRRRQPSAEGRPEAFAGQGRDAQPRGGTHRPGGASRALSPSLPPSLSPCRPRRRRRGAAGGGGPGRRWPGTASHPPGAGRPGGAGGGGRRCLRGRRRGVAAGGRPAAAGELPGSAPLRWMAAALVLPCPAPSSRPATATATASPPRLRAKGP